MSIRFNAQELSAINYVINKAINEYSEDEKTILNNIVSKINNLLSEDFVNVSFGEDAAEWIKSEKYRGYLECSHCHDCYIEPEWVEDHKWGYCPHCGFKMRMTK